jgi:hypothetical protein
VHSAKFYVDLPLILLADLVARHIAASKGGFSAFNRRNMTRRPLTFETVRVARTIRCQAEG